MTPTRVRSIGPARLACASLVLAFVPFAAAASHVLLHDDFSAYPPRMFSAGVVGAQAEYHFVPGVAQQGNWQVSTFRSPESQRAWHVVRHEGRPAMLQSTRTTDADAAYMHSVLVAGDPLWTDYTVTLRFEPLANDLQSGISFRHQHDRSYYFFGVLQGRAVLQRVNHAKSFRTAEVEVLAEQPYAWSPGREIVAVVTVRGDAITARLDDLPPLEARDATFAAGRIALLCDVPTRFYEVRVETDTASARTIADAIASRRATEARLQAENPKMVLWKRISTSGFGTSRQVRFGDLDNDGRIDVLFAQVRRHGPKDRNSEVGCLTAMTFDGKRLWQSGEPDPWNDLLTNDVAVQVHDVDGDGRTEVVFARDLRLVVADGATGRELRSIETPVNRASEKPFDKMPRILGDAVFFADFRGLGRKSDILLKDRYEQFWVYTDQLELLWSGTAVTGHFPYAADIDGDGRDELAIGYRLYDHDGTLLWNREDQLDDHADGVAIVDFDQTPGSRPRLLNAASDEGMVFMDLDGRITHQYFLGHAQNPATGNFRDDLPGLETVVINFWGNQGITTFFDARGNITHQCEPIQYGSMMLPVNWRGHGEELILLSPDVLEGGMIDGHGRRAVVFPADGHPVLANDALDVTGDCRDEIVVWDAYEMWVYTQDDNPRSGRLYKPKRNGLYNESNYKASVSLPGWSE
ncbi:hypothetical protein ASA1KI_37520 [Opitutales bacterium ASA1]|uniref:hypothetical protein n=1 Tax=Congregicoccus parvus TaxID=3081749 RepID=UPI002B2C702C|nr:hypothetical protein ASA1KI_37520 [Opitutales bacterium ASA1]